MTRVQKAVFPGIAVGIMFLVFFTSMIASPRVAFASNPPAATPAAEEAAAATAAVEEQPAAQEMAVVEQQAAAPSSDGTCSVSAGYPESVRQWCDFIERYAGEHSLDPNLIAAVMLQESGGNPQAYSKSGAVGLMQVMPRDGLASGFMCINGPCFASRPSSQELYDPEFNISYGAGMLADLIRRHGDVREALRAYGPMDMGYRYADIILSILGRY